MPPRPARSTRNKPKEDPLFPPGADSSESEAENAPEPKTAQSTDAAPAPDSLTAVDTETAAPMAPMASMGPPATAVETPAVTGSSDVASQLPRSTVPARAPVEHVEFSDHDESEHSDYDEHLAYDSEDDPVVRSYDIFMTSELAQNLYLFQYPVRSHLKPYKKEHNTCPIEARIKPKSQLVEIDVPIPTSANYDEEKGKLWGEVLRKAKVANEGGLPGKAFGGKGGKRRKVKEDSDDEEEPDIMYMELSEAIKKGRVLTKQTLSSKIQPDETKYMVGVFRGDQLHLTPVTSTVQMRPHFPHVDAQISQERAASKILRDSEQPEKVAEARAVHMQVKNMADPASQLSSTMKALRMAEGEDWKTLHWIDQEDGEAWDEYERLCLKDAETAGSLKTATSKTEYMDWLSGKNKFAPSGTK